jgi:hypothetical protein
LLFGGQFHRDFVGGAAILLVILVFTEDVEDLTDFSLLEVVVVDEIASNKDEKGDE